MLASFTQVTKQTCVSLLSLIWGSANIYHHEFLHSFPKWLDHWQGPISMDSFLSESLFSDGLIKELQNQHWSSVASGKTTGRLTSALLSTGLGSPGTGSCLVLQNSLSYPPLGNDKGGYTKGTEESANNSAPPSSFWPLAGVSVQHTVGNAGGLGR